MMNLEIRTPDDWHVHLRDEALLGLTVPLTAAQFQRAIVMPNLKPPVTTTALARAYRERILKALPNGLEFEPLMTCYLTDSTDAQDLVNGYQSGVFFAAKLYPAGATTHSDSGVTDWRKIRGVLESMQKAGVPLLIHGEVTNEKVDVFDREKVFIDRELTPLLKDFPQLKVVLEHITTSEAVDFVRANKKQLGATITAHHLMINRTDLFRGGLRPHLYCLPVAKREEHRLALRKAATSGEACFFLGTDSAPHALADKHSACGCAGIFSAPCAMSLYAEVFEEENALNQLEAFSSLNGPQFYDLKPNTGKMRLTRGDWRMESHMKAGSNEYQPFPFQKTIFWKFERL